MHQAPKPPPPSRREDPRLLTGTGCYVHDVTLPGMLHAAFVRSAYAHATINAIDTSAALDEPDVIAVLTGQDLPPLGLPAPNALVPDLAGNDVPLLPITTLVYVGQPVALVLARTPQAARRGADAVWVDCGALPAWVDHADDAPTVATLSFEQGATPGAAPHRVQVAQDQPRVVALALEPRAMVAQWLEATQSLQAWLPSQTPWRASASARCAGPPRAAKNSRPACMAAACAWPARWRWTTPAASCICRPMCRPAAAPGCPTARWRRCAMPRASCPGLTASMAWPSAAACAAPMPRR